MRLRPCCYALGWLHINYHDRWTVFIRDQQAYLVCPEADDKDRNNSILSIIKKSGKRKYHQLILEIINSVEKILPVEEEITKRKFIIGRESHSKTRNDSFQPQKARLWRETQGRDKGSNYSFCRHNQPHASRKRMI